MLNLSIEAKIEILKNLNDNLKCQGLCLVNEGFYVGEAPSFSSEKEEKNILLENSSAQAEFCEKLTNEGSWYALIMDANSRIAYPWPMCSASAEDAEFDHNWTFSSDKVHSFSLEGWSVLASVSTSFFKDIEIEAEWAEYDRCEQLYAA